MSAVLVDSSVWIDYFRGSGSMNIPAFEELVDTNRICVNDLILAELLPPLKIRKQHRVVDILLTIRSLPLAIDWEEIIQFQFVNIKNGINGVGIPDLIILQNAMQNDLALYSLDRHFRAMKKIHGLKIFN